MFSVGRNSRTFKKYMWCSWGGIHINICIALLNATFEDMVLCVTTFQGLTPNSGPAGAQWQAAEANG